MGEGRKNNFAVCGWVGDEKWGFVGSSGGRVGLIDDGLDSALEGRTEASQESGGDVRNSISLPYPLHMEGVTRTTFA